METETEVKAVADNVANCFREQSLDTDLSNNTTDDTAYVEKDKLNENRDTHDIQVMDTDKDHVNEDGAFDADLIVALPVRDVTNSVSKPGGKFVKQVSLPDCVSYNDIQGAVVPRDSSLPCACAGTANFFLSPYASSNTLTGSMYTASEGLYRSRSGITTLSEYTDCLYPSNANSFSKFPSAVSSLDQLTFQSCHSNLKFLTEQNEHDIESLENAVNEEKLKGLEENDVHKKEHGSNKKTKLFKGLNKRKCSKKRMCSKKENDLKQVQTIVTSDVASNSKVVIQGILKSSASCESYVDNVGNAHYGQGLKTEVNKSTGGTKALLIEKVSACMYCVFALCCL